MFLIFLCVLPSLAAGQGSVGPLQKLEDVGLGVFRGAEVKNLFRAGDLAYFTVAGSYTSEWLWRSDGTPEGTFQLDSIASPLTPSPRFWTSDGSRIYFTATGDAGRTPFYNLWTSDGTPEGTMPLIPMTGFGFSFGIDTSSENQPTALPVPETGLTFLTVADTRGLELWASDGTPEGTRFVKDIHPEGSSSPSLMAAFNGELYFLASLPQGRELWRSDGTTAGTERVEEFHHLGTGVVDLKAVGDVLFLLGQTASGVELWSSDGTGAGTTQSLFLPSSRILGHAAAEGRLFLAVHNSVTQQTELWVAEGDFSAPLRVLATNAPGPFEILALGGGAVFTLAGEPWRSDGTAEGTRQIIDLCTGPCPSSPDLLAVHAGRVLFLADDGKSGHEPWLTDGTAVRRFGDLCPGKCGSEVQQSGEVSGWLVLSTPKEIWMSDGGQDGAFKIVPARVQPSLRNLILPFGDRLLFSTVNTLFQGTLWSMPVTAPVPPEVLPGQWLSSPQVPGFRFKAVIEGQSFSQQSANCFPRTLCVMGGPRGTAEVFLRASGPKPDGSVWPAAIKLTTAPVDVWMHQVSTGYVRHHRLEGVDPSSTVLPGVLDRGFFPANPFIPA
ncbi:MAG TPA: hypothetical protein VFR31_21420, partial [Thermoanaerobaculia bacterium]|nr:hypothetical protein [Thermoanaerobaculia bacterium]